MRKVFIDIKRSQKDSFNRETLRAISRLESGKGIVQSIEERLSFIYGGNMPSHIRKLMKSYQEIIGISTDLPRDSCLIDVGFLQREKKILDELRIYGPKYIEGYSRYLLELLTKDHLTINDDHELDRVWHGYRSIRIAPAIIPDKKSSNRKEKRTG